MWIGAAIRGRGRRPPGEALLALFAVGSGNVAGLALGIVSGIVAARALGPTVRGEFVASATLAGVAAVALTLGMTQAVVTYRGEDNDLVGPLVLQAALAVLLGAGLFSVLAVTGAEPWLNPAGVVGAAALTTGSVLASNSAGLVQRSGWMTRDFQRVRLLPQGVGVIAAVILWALGTRNSDVWLLVIGIGILVPSALIMFGLVDGHRALTRLSMRLPRQLLRQAAGSFATVIGAQVIYRLDSLVVAIWIPTAKVAFYGVAVSAGMACAAIGQAVGMVTFSRLRDIRDQKSQQDIIRRSTALAFAVTSLVSLPLAAIAPIAIRIIYGSAFVPAVGATRVLVLAAIPLSVDYLLVHALLSVGAARSVFRVQVLAGVLTIASLGAIIPTGRIVFVALVSLCVYTISATLLFAAAMRRTNGVPSSTALP
jgi:O-antigen/teichoic acid export membrane protein